MGIFTKLSVRVYVLEYKALVQPADELVEKELCHVWCDVFSRKSLFLYKLSNF